jgi:hypothetical protein
LPQLPQLVLSLLRSRQAPPQLVRPVAQPLVEHAPAEQTLPVAHPLAHAPQFAGSLPRSTHLPPHSVVPTGQTQPPAEHS